MSNNFTNFLTNFALPHIARGRTRFHKTGMSKKLCLKKQCSKRKIFFRWNSIKNALIHVYLCFSQRRSIFIWKQHQSVFGRFISWKPADFICIKFPHPQCQSIHSVFIRCLWFIVCVFAVSNGKTFYRSNGKFLESGKDFIDMRLYFFIILTINCLI